jgi:nitroreductase
MNETLDNIFTRRSVRDFTDNPVSRQDLELIVEAGLSAPSAHGKRSWHIAVIENQSIRDRLTEKLQWFRPVKVAATSILVLGNPSAGVQKEYWPQDCAALTENILIAARSLGLGTTWCGIYPVEHNMEMVKSVLEIPRNLIPFGMIGIGHPLKSDAFRERDRADDDKRVSWNPNWGIEGS